MTTSSKQKCVFPDKIVNEVCFIELCRQNHHSKGLIAFKLNTVYKLNVWSLETVDDFYSLESIRATFIVFITT